MLGTKLAAEIVLDVAAALDRGARDYQEDALATGTLPGDEAGFVVLADGMGGHSAGDVASRLVVETVTAAMTEVLEAWDAGKGPGPQTVPRVLRAAAGAANSAVRAHSAAQPATKGMGATLLAAMIDGSRLWWLSVGDSPLWLWREGVLHRLNEVHSLAPQIDLMVDAGLMDPETARTHPDRSCLTSVIYGQDIARIDCPDRPVELRPGDLVIAASDGIEFIGKARIATVLSETEHQPSEVISGELMRAVRALADPDQDNVALSVLRVCDRAIEAFAVTNPRPKSRRPTTRRPTTLSLPFGIGSELFARLGGHGR
jgi:PPM family protein phosphatase